jgi:hypothetical protein
MNESPVTHPGLAMSLLEEHYYCEPDRLPVVCRLWRLRTPSPSAHAITYAVGLESLTKRYVYCVGRDESSARALVRRITENRLDPIHLGNVVADYLWEAEHGFPCGIAESE